ncbi:MAG TPA: hypothetical protein VKT82_33945 [Ktedonobacterales bacterium]|nr:hypothetical protein [Ktedonobacterales bacterium]
MNNIRGILLFPPDDAGARRAGNAADETAIPTCASEKFASQAKEPAAYRSRRPSRQAGKRFNPAAGDGR